MENNISELDVVALLADRPNLGLVSGQVGIVVEILDDGIFEVEFVDEDGQLYAMETLSAKELLVLHYDPAAAQKAKVYVPRSAKSFRPFDHPPMSEVLHEKSRNSGLTPFRRSHFFFQPPRPLFMRVADEWDRFYFKFVTDG